MKFSNHIDARVVSNTDDVLDLLKEIFDYSEIANEQNIKSEEQEEKISMLEEEIDDLQEENENLYEKIAQLEEKIEKLENDKNE